MLQRAPIAPADGRGQRRRGDRERTPLRRDPTAGEGERGAGRGRAGPLVDARPADGPRTCRPQCVGSARRRLQRDLPAGRWRRRYRAHRRVGEDAAEISATVIRKRRRDHRPHHRQRGRRLRERHRPRMIAAFRSKAPRTAAERLMVAPLLVGNDVKGVLAVWRIAGTPFNTRRSAVPGRPPPVRRRSRSRTPGCSPRPSNARPSSTRSTRVSQQLAGATALRRALIELVGEQIRSLFDADIAYVALVDRDADLITFPYVFGESARSAPDGSRADRQVLGSGAVPISDQLDLGNSSDETVVRTDAALVPRSADRRRRRTGRASRRWCDTRREHAYDPGTAAPRHDRRQRRRRAPQRAAVREPRRRGRPPRPRTRPRARSWRR